MSELAVESRKAAIESRIDMERLRVIEVFKGVVKCSNSGREAFKGSN
jgi:hypothetical protein